MRYLAIAAVGGRVHGGRLARLRPGVHGRKPAGGRRRHAGIFLVPAVVIAGGVLAAAVDRGPRSYLAVVAGAVATVIAYAAWYRMSAGPEAEFLEFGAIGIGLAVSMLTVGFVPTVVVLWLVARSRRA